MPRTGRVGGRISSFKKHRKANWYCMV